MVMHTIQIVIEPPATTAAILYASRKKKKFLKKCDAFEYITNRNLRYTCIDRKKLIDEPNERRKKNL